MYKKITVHTNYIVLVFGILLWLLVLAPFAIPFIHPTSTPANKVLWGTNMLFGKGMATAQNQWHPTVIRLAKEAGVKVWRTSQWAFGYPYNEVELKAWCQSAKENGFEPFVILHPRTRGTDDTSLAIKCVTSLGPLCNYYSIGNEPFNPAWNYNPTTYAQTWRQIYLACKDINPKAKFGGPVCSDPYSDWNAGVGSNRQFWNTWFEINKDILTPERCFLDSPLIFLFK